MPHLISNLYEKNYTPFTAKLAPRNLWNRPVLGKCIKSRLILIKIKYREKTTKDKQTWSIINMEGHLEIHQIVDLPQP